MKCRKADNAAPYRLWVAPMMGVSDRHFRRFMRVLAPRARLVTEMLHEQAVRNSARSGLLDFDAAEHPLVLQLGGADPSALAAAAQKGEAAGFDEINLNAGCPSSRVQHAQFGASLMQTPALAAECLAAMRAAVRIPVSLKCRLGVDEQDEDALWAFLDAAHGAGVRHFIVHARKAWLAGVSPKDNRRLPPLNYPLVYAAKRAYPDCIIVLNGGVASAADALAHTRQTDGVMLGRAAQHDTWSLRDTHAQLFTDACPATRADAVAEYLPYLETQHQNNGVPLHLLARVLLGLAHGVPGARQWRRAIMGARAPADIRAAGALLAPAPALRSA